MEMTPKLSIIIVNWNTAELLRQCLNSLVQSSKACPELAEGFKVQSEIIVVDNGSTDDSVKLIQSLKLKVIQNKENLGFAKGNNIGIKEATGEYIMLLNTDTVVKEGAVEKLVEFLDRSSDEVAAISPLILNSDDTIQKDPCFLKYPSPLSVLFYYNSILKNIALKFFPKLLFSVTDFSKPSLVDQLPGAAMMIKKKVLDEIGLFDEKFQIYFEDSDLCMRMKKAGYMLSFEPSAKIVHLGRQSIKPIIDKEGIEKFYLLNFESLFRFCKKHYSFMKYFSIKIIILLQLLLTGKIGLFVKLII